LFIGSLIILKPRMPANSSHQFSTLPVCV
jgi:hypothetical protein